MAKSFSTLKNKMSLTAQKAVEEKTSQLLKEVLLHEIHEQLHITQEDIIARAIVFAPQHLCIREIVICPTRQAP